MSNHGLDLVPRSGGLPITFRVRGRILNIQETHTFLDGAEGRTQVSWEVLLFCLLHLGELDLLFGLNNQVSVELWLGLFRICSLLSIGRLFLSLLQLCLVDDDGRDRAGNLQPRLSPHHGRGVDARSALRRVLTWNELLRSLRCLPNPRALRRVQVPIAALGLVEFLLLESGQIRQGVVWLVKLWHREPEAFAGPLKVL